MDRYRIYGICILLLCSVTYAKAGTFRIVQKGQASAVIIIAQDASQAEQFAAEELQKIIQRMSGVVIPVRSESGHVDRNIISIGYTALADKNNISVNARLNAPDPFRILTKENVLYLIGNGDRGTIYSVYHLAETYFGCRWYGPYEWMHEYPELESISIDDTDILQEPAFEYRIFISNFSMKDGTLAPYCKWALRNKINLTGNDEQTGDAERYGGLLTGRRTHGFDLLIPPAVYFHEHPEYFDLRRDKRIPSSGHMENHGQLCLTNPEVIALIARQIVDEYQAKPNQTFFSLSPNDTWLFCECKRCKAHDSNDYFLQDEYLGRRIQKRFLYPILSDRLYYFLNQTAEKVYSNIPNPEDVFDLYTLAYNLYVYPPDKVQSHPKVLPGICHMRPSCYAHSISCDYCTENVLFAKILHDWAAVSDNLGYYAYYHKAFWAQLLYPIHRNIYEDLRFLHKLDFKLFYSQGRTESWGHSGLNYYILSKCMWNAELDYDALWKDYFAGYFRESADPMKRYYTILEEAMRQPGIFVRGRPHRQAPVFLTDDVMCNAREALNQAKGSAREERIVKRIDIVAKAFRFTEMFLHLNVLSNQYSQTKDAFVLEQFGKEFRVFDEYIESLQGQNVLSTYLARSRLKNRGPFQELLRLYDNR